MSIITSRRSISLLGRMVFPLNSSLRPNSYVVPLPCRCRAEHIVIRCGTSTAFSGFDSYVEPNLSNLMTNQAKMSFNCRK